MRNHFKIMSHYILIRALFVHVVMPGQEPGAADLPDNFVFPTMDVIGLNLVTILDHLRIKQVNYITKV